MTTTKCPICSNQTLEHKHGEYRFEPPQNMPGGTMIIRDASWDACSSYGEDILSDELTKAIEAERNRRLRLRTPPATKNRHGKFVRPCGSAGLRPHETLSYVA